MQGAWVQSLVVELRSHTLCVAAKGLKYTKKKKKRLVWLGSCHTLGLVENRPDTQAFLTEKNVSVLYNSANVERESCKNLGLFHLSRLPWWLRG